jgi:hypothetical protein
MPMTAEKVSTASPRRDTWHWVAMAAALALVALSAGRLITLAGWERTLVFARDLLPSAIGAEAMTLAAYCLILAFIAAGGWRRWGLALGIAWGAITVGTWLWPHAENFWFEMTWRLHMSKVLRQVFVVGGPELRLARWRAALGLVLAAASGKSFADLPREPLDRGVLQAAAFFAVFYFLVVKVVASFLIIR